MRHLVRSAFQRKSCYVTFEVFSEFILILRNNNSFEIPPFHLEPEASNHISHSEIVQINHIASNQDFRLKNSRNLSLAKIPTDYRVVIIMPVVNPNILLLVARTHRIVTAVQWSIRTQWGHCWKTEKSENK